MIDHKYEQRYEVYPISPQISVRASHPSPPLPASLCEYIQKYRARMCKLDFIGTTKQGGYLLKESSNIVFFTLIIEVTL
uniref:Uncharacterized protein n=1 Tax=Onchocerca volvulus TaxID=6282 RepID=A0A8R1XVQ7_ONCVO